MKLLRAFLVAVILATSFFTLNYSRTPIVHAQDQEVVYVGSRNSTKYHYPSCVWAKKIKPSNLVTFTGKEDAANKGYVPCKVCKP